MPGNNIIQKQIVQVDINLPGISPFAAQELAAKWCNEVLTPAINKRLEKYALLDDAIRLDKIAIELNDEMGSLNDALAEQIAAEIENRIETGMISGVKTSIIKKDRTVFEAFIYFLQNGYLPWWSSIRSNTQLQLALKNIASGFTNEESIVFRQVLSEPAIVKRLVVLASENFADILFVVFQTEKNLIRNYLQKINRMAFVINNEDLQFQFLISAKQLMVIALLHDADETSLLKQLSMNLLGRYQIKPEALRSHFKEHDIFINQEIFKELDTLKIQDDTFEETGLHVDGIPDDHDSTAELISLAAKKLKQQEQTSQKAEGIYISNAGLVLTAAFLPRFFENLGIIEDGRFNSKDLALAMLQWLAAGTEDYAEFDLVLPKILCGMEPEEPAIIIPHLPASFKNEGDNLLQSIIDHWSILKNTTADGLRQSFLQREGKLSLVGNEWLLQVEQKPYDMLLEHLPWNITMTRLSWMQRLVRTEWIE